ncbi:MAG: AgmX/PglI C-terminal domain-containing protein [Polyangiales bacterium]
MGDLVDLHPPIVEGLLAADAVSTALAQHVDEVARCYEARLAIDPGLAGRVELRLVVGALGRVMDVPTASGAGPIAPVGACVADVARGWRFPPPEMSGIAVVRATFALHPSANASARDR